MRKRDCAKKQKEMRLSFFDPEQKRNKRQTELGAAPVHVYFSTRSVAVSVEFLGELEDWRLEIGDWRWRRRD